MSGSILSDLLLTITDRGRGLLGRNGRKADPGVGGLVELCEALLSGRGEATGMALAREVLDRFENLDEAAQLAFFQQLADNFGADRQRLKEAIDAWHEDLTDERAADLHFISEPRRQELFRRLNRTPGGTVALVAMRARILDLLPDNPRLASVDRDILHLLSSWFNRGFLFLRPIDWSAPAIVLEKIARYEAVHEVRDWNDLRRRIDPPDRRCYAFFHPALVNEPLIFVEVALTTGIPGAIDPILATEREPITPEKADTAVFYSISNCQKGLRGVSFGNFLIKQVVDELARDLPDMKAFVTLSPVPGFRKWLARSLKEDSLEILGDEDRATLDHLGADDWYRDPQTAEAVKAVLLPIVGYYFLRAKNSRGEPVDPVARFHLGNGARLERINWLGDTSESGLMASAGLMVNYRYELKDIEKNHEAFANHGEIAASGDVLKLLRQLSRSSALA